MKMPIFKNDFDKDMFLTSLFVSMYDGARPCNVKIPQIAPNIFHKGFMDTYLQKNFEGKEKIVSILDFNILNNHFHLVCYCRTKGGISLYLKKIQLSLTHRYNIANRLNGHVLQGPFQAKLVDNESYYFILTEYVRNNHIQYPELYPEKVASDYPYSSLYDAVKGKRWDALG